MPHLTNVAAPEATKPLKIFIHALDGAGHLNACLGIAQALAKRGHRVIHLLNSAFKGQFSQFGFEEILLYRRQSKVTKNPVNILAKQLLKSGILSGKSSLEKLLLAKEVKDEDNVIQTMFDSTLDFNLQIEAAIQLEQPDLIILDHYLVPPSIQQANIPWMLLFSGNPLCLYDSEMLPPHRSGYPTTCNASLWTEFRRVQSENFVSSFAKKQKKLNKLFDYTFESVDAYVSRSKYLNIYQYPEELDYQDVVPIPEGYARVDTFLREILDPFELPEEFAFRKPGEKLIYLSLGSMGSIDVQLMKRIVSVLAKTPHKFIVSKGPLHHEYELPDNCWGKPFLPQTRILPLVDLVITHGGNNTVTEAFACGKPMIVLPLFGDQYDNAQRVHEKGFGVRLETYTFTDEQLIRALDGLLSDKLLYERLQKAKKRIESSNSKELLCHKIEQVVQSFQNKQLNFCGA